MLIPFTIITEKNDLVDFYCIKRAATTCEIRIFFLTKNEYQSYDYITEIHHGVSLKVFYATTFFTAD